MVCIWAIDPSGFNFVCIFELSLLIHSNFGFDKILQKNSNLEVKIISQTLHFHSKHLGQTVVSTLIFFTCIQLYLSKVLSRSYFAGDTDMSYPILTSTNVTCTPFNFLPRQHTFEFVGLSLYIRCSSCSSWTQLNQEMYIIYMYMKRSNNGIGQRTRLDVQFLFYRYLALNVQ